MRSIDIHPQEAHLWPVNPPREWVPNTTSSPRTASGFWYRSCDNKGRPYSRIHIQSPHSKKANQRDNRNLKIANLRFQSSSSLSPIIIIIIMNYFSRHSHHHLYLFPNTHIRTGQFAAQSEKKKNSKVCDYFAKNYDYFPLKKSP